MYLLIVLYVCTYKYTENINTTAEYLDEKKNGNDDACSMNGKEKLVAWPFMGIICELKKKRKMFQVFFYFVSPT